MNRQKLLLGALGAAIAAWQLPGIVNSLVFEPVSSRQEQIDDLQRQIDKQENERRRQRKAVKQLAELGKRSLPPDPLLAPGVFQNWLHEVSSAAKLTNVVVERPQSDPQVKENTYFVVHGVMKAQGTLAQVADLLDEFQKSGLMLKITNLRMKAPRRDADPNLDIELAVDALAMLSSPSRTTLWHEGRAPGPLPETKLVDRETIESITKKNLFVRTYNGPPKPADPPPPPPPPPPTTPPTPSTAEYVYLVGSVIRNGVPDAFLYDRSSNQQTVLRRGGDFKAGGMEGKVLEIADKSVTLRVGEDEFRLELGKNLTQMEKLPRPQEKGS